MTGWQPIITGIFVFGRREICLDPILLMESWNDIYLKIACLWS